MQRLVDPYQYNVSGGPVYLSSVSCLQEAALDSDGWKSVQYGTLHVHALLRLLCHMTEVLGEWEV